MNFLLAIALLAGPVLAAQPDAATRPTDQRRGFYLHAAWAYEYPFAVRTWQRADYDKMFQLLGRLGFNSVMLWPVLEAVPAPISAADREAVAAFRPTIEDARKRGLETWLAQSAAVASTPEIAARPWLRRSLYAHMKTVHLDDPRQAEAYLRHRAALMEILNNADGYVTIDGDPGGYGGAKPADFLKVFRHDRQTIDRVGTHPKRQELVPWIWCGWGTRGVWQEPIAPFVAASLDAVRRDMPEPWELLVGRSIREGWANGRINVELAKKAGLMDRSTVLCYEAIELEPSPPAVWLQLDDVRRILRQELREAAGVRGFYGNAQTPILAIPNLYLFARGAADPSYLDQSDEKVLGDLARLLGGPPELLVPAWSCLRLELAAIPDDLPMRLRAAKLTGPLAALLPGGPARYLDILAAQADSRIRLLRACGRAARTPQEAVAAVAEGAAALVDWWRLHRYVGGGEEDEPFRWRFVHRSQYRVLKDWCEKNITDPRSILDSAAAELARRSTLSEQVARARMRELLGVSVRADESQGGVK
jgi:hypothetical protein